MGPAPNEDELASAVREAIAQQPRGREAEVLAAFVYAWHQHWPPAFVRAFGDDAGSVIAWAAENATDDNRYLKLRRIALERLATVL